MTFARVASDMRTNSEPATSSSKYASGKRRAFSKADYNRN
jgi:hypothetical protein